MRGGKARLLELHAEVLRARQGDRRELGVRAGEVRRDSRARRSRTARRSASRCRAAEIEDITRNQAAGLARLDAAGVRYPEPHDVLDRRAHGDQSEPDGWPHVVLADHPAHRRSDLRGQPRVRPGREGARPADQRVGFSLPTTYWNRAFIYLFGFPVSRDIATNKSNRAKFERLVQIAAEHGWGEYRTPPAYQEAVLSTYSFNNHALRRFHETLKDAVDPNGILVGRPLWDLAEASTQSLGEFT